MDTPDRAKARGRAEGLPLSSLPRPITLNYCTGAEEQAGGALEAWASALAEEARGKIVCNRVEAKDQPFLPSLSLTTRKASAVHYHFVPEGPEVPVFREFLWQAASPEHSDAAGPGEPAPSSPPLREMLLFVSTHCPNCPRAVRTVLAIAGELPNLSVHLFEALLDADLAERHAIRSVPTLLVDRDLRYVGSLNEKKLVSILRSSDPASLLQEKIRNQIREGRALEAAEWIAGGGDPGFLAFDLGNSTFEQRLALLLALEEALEADPRCLDRLVAPLLPYLETADASIRGDIADLLGKIGDARALPALKGLCRDADPNVAEAAAEALQAIEAGYRQAAE
jgi:hypothetical protein